MKHLLLTAFLLLGACSDLAGNEKGGIISNANINGSTFREADAHCRQYGKLASVRQTMDTFATRGIVFDCI